MLFIYYKSDGEIHRATTGAETLKDFFGDRTKEFSQIFDCLYIEEYNDFVFRNYYNFKVKNGKLTPMGKLSNLFSV